MGVALVLRMIGRAFLLLGLYLAADELRVPGLWIACIAFFIYLIGSIIKEHFEVVLPDEIGVKKPPIG